MYMQEDTQLVCISTNPENSMDVQKLEAQEKCENYAEFDKLNLSFDTKNLFLMGAKSWQA